MNFILNSKLDSKKKEKASFRPAWFLVLSVLLILGLLVFWASFKKMPGTGDAERITLTVDFGNGEVRKFSTSNGAQYSAWDLLQQANAGGLKVEVAGAFFPKVIEKYENGENGGKNWRLYVNGLHVSQSPIEIKLNRGDLVAWKYE